MELEIGRTIRLIESRTNGIEIIGKFLKDFELIKEYRKETRDCFLYKHMEYGEKYLAELFFDENVHEGYIRIEKQKNSLNLNG